MLRIVLDGDRFSWQIGSGADGTLQIGNLLRRGVLDPRDGVAIKQHGAFRIALEQKGFGESAIGHAANSVDRQTPLAFLLGIRFFSSPSQQQPGSRTHNCTGTRQGD